MNIYLIIIILLSVLGVSLVCSYLFNKQANNNKFSHVANTIRSAVSAFSIRQASFISGITLLLSLMLWYFNYQLEGIMLLAGSVSMMFMGMLHMYTFTYGNVITAMEMKSGLIAPFIKAIMISGSSGILMHSLSIIIVLIISKCCGLSLAMYFMGGISLSSLIIRLTGGVFTKSADIGADLLGKIELSLAEDDARNPLVIADNVGDNVGDSEIAATGSFENWILVLMASQLNGLPMIRIGAISLIIPTICMFLFKFMMKYLTIMQSIMSYVLLCGGLITSLLAAFNIISGQSLCMFIIGIISMLCVCLVAYRFTGGCSVRNVTKLTENGAAINIIGGLAEGYLGTGILIGILVLVLIILKYVGFNAINMIYVACGAICISPSILILDGVGPIMDNAAGMIEMCEPENRHTADTLDRVGNTTKAITKIYSALVSIYAVITWLFLIYQQYNINVLFYDISLWINMFIGIIFTLVLTCLSLGSVSGAAFKIIEITRQKLSEWQDNVTLSNHLEIVGLLTNISIHTIIKPIALCCMLPFINIIISHYLNINNNITTFQITLGIIISSIIIGMVMMISGSLWDNVKKAIEIRGDKKKPIYHQAVIGDMVGDPFKDTTAPLLIGITKFIVCLFMCIKF